jgi:hypothetical protein
LFENILTKNIRTNIIKTIMGNFIKDHSKTKSVFITSNIVILGLVSFFTDISTEMVYPILPLYLFSNKIVFVVLFILYGFYTALTTGIERALIVEIVPKRKRQAPWVYMPLLSDWDYYPLQLVLVYYGT